MFYLQQLRDQGVFEVFFSFLSFLKKEFICPFPQISSHFSGFPLPPDQFTLLWFPPSLFPSCATTSENQTDEGSKL